MPNPPLAPILDAALGGEGSTVAKMHTLRLDGLSWDDVADTISAETGIDVSREWCRRTYVEAES